MKKFLTLLAAGAALFTIGCGSSDSSSNVTDAKVVENIPADTMLNVIKASVDQNASSAFGYKAIKLTYTTKDVNGNEVEASGIMVIPEGFPYPLSIVVDNHGTIFKDSEAPSNVEVSDNQPNLPTAVAFSSYAGFVTVMPDYLGYGVSKGKLHPYIMTKSAQASIDMLNAAVKYLQDNGYQFSNNVYITGYSEGGYVAMSMAKELQDENTSYNIAAVAPMAGPYNVEKLALFDLNDSMKMVLPAFLADVAYSYSKAYNLPLQNVVDKPEVFENYNLFGGDYDTVAIHYYLGLTDLAKGDYGIYTHYPHELFTPQFLEDFKTNPDNQYRVKFKENNVYAWKPNMAVDIINCEEDEVIPKFIAEEANATMNAYGATNVQLTLIPTSQIEAPTQDAPLVHKRCGATAYKYAVGFFNTVRTQLQQTQSQ